jgi:hypothetical protein
VPQARIEVCRKLPATPNQEAVLRRNLLYLPGMTRGQASDAIADLYGPRRPPGPWGGPGAAAPGVSGMNNTKHPPASGGRGERK